MECLKLISCHRKTLLYFCPIDKGKGNFLIASGATIVYQNYESGWQTNTMISVLVVGKLPIMISLVKHLKQRKNDYH